MVITDAQVSVDDVDVSGNNTRVAIAYSAAAVDTTAMGADTRKNLGGLKEWSVAMEFNGDEAVTGPFFAKVGTVVPIKIRAKSDAISETNPSYEGDGLITEFAPLDAAVGDKHSVTLTVVSAGTLARVTEVTP
jgi:hypothetical protein